MANIILSKLDSSNRAWAMQLLTSQWGADCIVTRSRVHHYRDLEGCLAFFENHPAGLVTYWINNGECELTSLNSQQQNLGIGTALLQETKRAAFEAGCRRIWLITTNDNTHALRFYQKRGYILKALYRDAVRKSRKLKATIPLTGNDGIPLRDEIELELLL